MKKSILKVDGAELTIEDVEDYFGMSDSDGSDWGDIKEIEADNFLVENKKRNVVQPVRRTFQKENLEPSVILKKSVVKEINNVPQFSNKKDNRYFTAIPTKLRVMNPSVTQETWKERVKTRKVLVSSNLTKVDTAEQLVDEDWIFVGVIAEKSGTKKTKNDQNYSIWMLSDLQNFDHVVKFMLFSDVYNTLWTESQGTVIAILRPKLLKQDKLYKDLSFTVDNPAQVIILGRSPDFGICEGRKKSGDKCTNAVNKTECSLCIYHIQSTYSAATSRPGFSDIRNDRLNSRKRVGQDPSWKTDAKKAKNTGVFVNNLVVPTMSMDKLHKAGVTTLATNWGLLDKSVITKLDESGFKNTNNVDSLSKKDLKFAELLKKPGAGSMNFVKSLAEKTCGSSAISRDHKKRSKVFDNGCPTVAKGLTCASVLSSMKNDVITRNDSQQYIDLGLKPVNLSKVSAELYKAELAKLRLSALAKSKGGFTALKEDNLLNHLKNVGREKAPVQNKVLSEEMLKLLHRGSSNMHLADQSKKIENEKKLDNLEKVEKMELKLSGTHEQRCVYFYCNDCKTKSRGSPKICVLEGHKVDREKGFNRFFRCLKCKYRLMTLEKYPDESCIKCGSNVFEKTGIIQDKIVNDKVLIDGGEKRFINN